LGPLVEFLGDRIIIDFSLGRDARLTSIIAGKEWIWPPSKSTEWIELIWCTSTSFLPDDGMNDLLCWKDAPKGMFSNRCTWNSIRDKVEWWKLVWHKHVIPWFSFMLWIAINDALSTQNKLRWCYGIIQTI
jgi:hypothetical protein